MTINEMIPLSMAEAKELVETPKKSSEKGKKTEVEEEKEAKIFLKKFTKLDYKKAMTMRKELEETGILKIKAEHIAKIIDLIPEDASDLNKIFVDVGLEENETNKLLEITKKYS